MYICVCTCTCADIMYVHLNVHMPLYVLAVKLGLPHFNCVQSNNSALFYTFHTEDPSEDQSTPAPVFRVNGALGTLDDSSRLWIDDMKW